MIQNRRDMPLKIKAVDESGTFSGYGSVFGVKDSYDDIVMPGAFSKSLKSRMPALLWQHDTDEPLGVYTRVEEDDHGLYVEGKLLIDSDPLAARAHGLLKAGGLSGLSIGFMLQDYTYDDNLEAFKLTEIDLREISLVTFPANEEARVQSVKSLLAMKEIPAPKQVEAILRDAGFSRQQAKAMMAKGYSGISQREADHEAELKAIAKLTEMMKG